MSLSTSANYTALAIGKLKTAESNHKVALPKLLVVDDEPDTVFLLKNILEREGYEVLAPQMESMQFLA
jgi:PleD family two-component response regulator